MNKLFLNLINKDKDKDKDNTSSKIKSNQEKSAPLITFGVILSITSIFLLLFTINNKFG